MKKNYSKPDILFDSFAMATSVAANCELDATFERNVCGVEMTRSITIFSEGVTQCNFIYKDEEYDGLCYHVPFESYNVFNS